MSGKFQTDVKNAADVRARIRALAASYTPEWVFDERNPDIGSVIAMIFAQQAEGNILRLNRVLDKYRTEFVNLLELSSRPGRSARGVAILSLIGDTVSGVNVPKGTRLLGRENETGDPLIFETTDDLYATSARLRDVIAVSPSEGKILSVMGGARAARLPWEPRADDDAPAEAPETGFRLFDFSEAGIARNALIFFHRSMFDMAGGAIYARVETDGAADDETDAAMLGDPKRYRWSYLSESGMRPLESVALRNGELELTADGDSVRARHGDDEMSVLMLEPVGAVRSALTIRTAGFISRCAGAAADFVSHNAGELAKGAFMPFGREASVFDECYIGSERIFDKQGATITLSFDLSFEEKFVSLIAEGEEEHLAIIKRKPRVISVEAARAAVDALAIEYFNGVGWRRLDCARDVTDLFAGEHAGETDVTFRCPDDWRPLAVGGHTGRCVRLRVERADNCYLRPCVHRMPVVSDFSISYAYPEGYVSPSRITRISGTRVDDLSAAVRENTPFEAFSPLPGEYNTLYVGFDKRFDGAPVSLFFDAERGTRADGAAMRFAYSSASGFRELHPVDNIGSFAGPGTIRFMPPPDFAETAVEGVRRFWLRLSDEDGIFDAPEVHKPLIRAILPNAAEMLNTETLPQESFYIDAVRPNMTFRITDDVILSAEVFVNERTLHTADEMRRMAAERPEDVQIAHNTMGEISEFFVRWEEVENFDFSGSSDRHYRLDRMTGRILFGDGVSVMAPKAQNGEAFRVTIRRCGGERGNLPAGAVGEIATRLLHIGEVRNPLATWAGSDPESADEMRERGANLICAQNRLREPRDFLREVKLCSSSVVAVACEAGVDSRGRPDARRLTVAVLTRDYAGGAYSFADIRKHVENRILSKCDATVSREMLTVTEPIYTELSCMVYADVADERSAFVVRAAILDALENFIAPVTPEGKANREIGVLPDEVQIRLLLNTLHIPADIRMIATSARWEGENGTEERALSDVKAGPFTVGVNGKHAVFLTKA